MEVFDKEGVAVRKNRSEGFVMAEVLVTVLFVTVFTSLLFSSGARRYRSALNFAAGTEARLAAEAVVQILVENMCQEEPTGILEKLQGPEGLPETEDWKWGEKEDRDSHLLLLERGRFRTCVTGGLYCK